MRDTNLQKDQRPAQLNLKFPLVIQVQQQLLVYHLAVFQQQLLRLEHAQQKIHQHRIRPIRNLQQINLALTLSDYYTSRI